MFVRFYYTSNNTYDSYLKVPRNRLVNIGFFLTLTFKPSFLVFKKKEICKTHPKKIDCTHLR